MSTEGIIEERISQLEDALSLKQDELALAIEALRFYASSASYLGAGREINTDTGYATKAGTHAEKALKLLGVSGE